MTALNSSAKATLRMADHDIGATGRPEKPVRLSTRLASELTAELDWAQQSLGLAADEILLAALGRAIARTIDDGVVAVDIGRDGRSVSQPVYLTCATVQQSSATEMLRATHCTIAALRHHGFEHGVLATEVPSETFFNFVGTVPEPPFGEGLGHALEIRIYRTGGLWHLDWWYDARRFYRVTVEELAEQFPLALIELTSEAIPAA